MNKQNGKAALVDAKQLEPKATQEIRNSVLVL